MKIENYKISLYDCKNKHKINNILFNKYEDYQKKDISKIVTCGKNGLYNYQCSINNQRFRDYCNKYKKNICIECEHSVHKSEFKSFREIFTPKSALKEKLKEIEKFKYI